MNILKTFLLPILLLSQGVTAQVSSNVPRPTDDKVDFTKIENIIIYIVLPLIIVVLYFVYRKTKKREIEKAAEQEAMNKKNKTNNEL